MTRRLRQRDDQGFSLILVMGIGFALLAFAIVAATTSVRALKDSSSHVSYAQNLDTAEAGIDQVSARLQATNGAYTLCPTTTNVTSCDIPASARVSGFANQTAERTWAETTLKQLAADDQTLLKTTTAGQYLTIRPPSINTIYSMSWVPSYAKPTRQRLVKSEYIFSTYHPANAILTNGNITCCPSYDIGLDASAPAGTSIGIHTNGNLGGVPGHDSGLTVEASATGTCSGCTANTPTQTVPTIDPRLVYNSESSKYSGSWFDLCPDGKVRSPNTASNGVPCTGTVLATQPYRGWSLSGTTWDVDDDGTGYPGVYYVYRGNVHVGNSHTALISGATTILTEATANRACPRADGNITLDNKSTWSGGPYIAGMMLLAGGNFTQNNQAVTTGTGGAYLAQGSVNQNTSSHDGLIGLMIAEDFCGETNDLQGSILYYDGGADLPLGSLIRSTLEMELN